MKVQNYTKHLSFHKKSKLNKSITVRNQCIWRVIPKKGQKNFFIFDGLFTNQKI